MGNFDAKCQARRATTRRATAVFGENALTSSVDANATVIKKWCRSEVIIKLAPQIPNQSMSDGKERPLPHSANCLVRIARECQIRIRKIECLPTTSIVGMGPSSTLSAL